MPSRPRALYVTDLTYPAAGRRYGDEDAWLSAQLRPHLATTLCHPADAVAFADDVDVVIVRNSGPVLHHRIAWDALKDHAAAHGTAVYNPLTGLGDMAGKRYLVDLTAAGFPVIPTVDLAEDLGHLPVVDRYVVKPILGADSIGLQVVDRDDLASAMTGEVLAQPLIDFAYEVSFTFVDDELQYALHAPDPAQRWVLEPYDPTPADLAFAERFVGWNELSHGIQRIDACRTRDGRLLLVEVEDLNPYLSLDRVDEPTRTRFVDRMAASVLDLIDA